MKKVMIGEALSAGWNSFKSRPWYLLGLSLSVGVLFIFCSSQNAAVTALAYILYGGYLAMLIRHFNGEKIIFDDLFNADSRWVSFAFLALIKSILIFLGLVFFIIPGVYLAIRWMFAELLVIDQGMKPLQALRASSEMTKGVKWKLLLFVLVAVLLTLLGLLFFIVGAFIASLVLTFAMIKIYNDIRSSQLAQNEHAGS